MNLKTIALLGGLLLVSQPLWAQTATSPSTAMTSGGAFQSLSSGNQKIVDALFAAQTPSGTAVALSKDQIATMKEGGGWGKVFRQMKADGLLSAKNLGQVVSAHEHALHSASTTSSATGRGTASSHASRDGATSAHGGRSATMAAGAGFHGATHMASHRSGYGYSHMGYAGGHGAYSGSYGYGAYGGAGFANYGHGGMGGGYAGGGFAGGHGGGFGGGHGR